MSQADDDAPEEAPPRPRTRARRRRRPKGSPGAPARRARRASASSAARAGWSSPERRLAVTGTVTIVGLAMVGTGASDVGAVVALIGALSLFWSVHLYGRLGPDSSPLEHEAESGSP